MKTEITKIAKRGLRDNQIHRDHLFTDLCYDDLKEMPFINFLQYNQWLYEGVDLNKNEIDYINNYFFDFNVNPTNFERKFHRVISRALPTYKLLKAHEIQDDIFKITNNDYVRHLTTKTLGSLTSDKTGTNKQTQNGSNNNTFTGKTTDTATSNNNNKTANKTLPMSSDSSGFDSLFDWEGASGVQESDTNTDSSDTTNTNNTTVDTSTNTINQETVDKLKNITNNDLDTWETMDNRNGNTVDIINNLWLYLIKPKAIDWLINELKKCFILVY